jgi:CRP-like cAMP-binding protein
MMQLNVSFLTNFMNDVSNRAQFISGKLKFLSFQSLKGKLAHYLLEQDYKGQGKIVLTKTQEQLADFFGVARPSLGRVIRDMHNDGVIFAAGKNIEIRDRATLQSYLGK